MKAWSDCANAADTHIDSNDLRLKFEYSPNVYKKKYE